MQVNSQTLESSVCGQLSSILASSNSTSSVPNSHTSVSNQQSKHYAAVASSVLPSPSVAATNSSSVLLHRNVSAGKSQLSDDRELNLILF